MKEEFVYLTYYQSMAFMLKINEIKNDKQYFDDNITDSFASYVLERTYEIAMNNNPIKLKFFPNSCKYKISKSLYNYLSNITSIDVFDKDTLNEYTKLITDFENMTDDIIEDNIQSHHIKIKK